MSKSIQKTSKGLANVMFEELEALRSGKSTPQKARAVASMANTICAITRLEMDFARFVASERADVRGNSLKALPLA